MSNGGNNGTPRDKDQRLNFILRLASQVLSLNITSEKIRNTGPIDNFLDTNTIVLVISRHEQKGVDFSNTVAPQKGQNGQTVVFYKTRPQSLTSENFRSLVNVVTLNGKTNEVFLSSVQQVFGKSFSSDSSNRQLLSVVNDLEENLLATVEKGKGDAVTSLPDEISLWRGRKDKTGQQYSDAFEGLAKFVDSIESRPIEELSGFVEAAEDTVDALWNCSPSYPEGRMKSLINAIASTLSDEITRHLEASDIWSTNADNEERLRSVISVCEEWRLGVKLLTSQTWPRTLENKWKGQPLDLPSLTAYQKRLEEVLSLRQLCSQAAFLLEDRDAERELQKVIESTLGDFSIFSYSPQNEKTWRTKLQATERAIWPKIEKTIPLLKARLRVDKLDNSLIFSDLEKYRNFLSRDIIKEKLMLERETLLTKVRTLISTINPLDIASAGDLRAGRFLTNVASSIVALRQSVAQITTVQSSCSDLLSDLSGYQELAKQMTLLLKQLNEMEENKYSQWCRETISAIDDPDESIALETNGRIMVLEQSNGTLHVNYSDRLLRLLREVRQLSSLGLTIPAKISNAVSNGEKYYRYGVTLKQIAHFYNTIDQQMLPCQQALMLDEALAFEKLVIPQKKAEAQTNWINTVIWEKPEQLDEYIVLLQGASDKLSNHNRRLRNSHSYIVEKVLELAGLDLLKEVNKWKEHLTAVRSKIQEEESVHGASKQNIRPWQLHWDRQIFKALQLQYQWGLESMHTQIPPINAQLVFTQQKLQLRPPIEEIRMRYYKELRRFLSLPENFKGVIATENNQPTIFPAIIDLNAGRFDSLYEKAEHLLSKVSGIDKEFEDWVVLGQVDLESLIEENFSKASDWEAQLKMLKTKGREAERLPSEVRFDCIIVSTTPVKTAVEEELQRLFDTLVWSLRHVITTQLQSITMFLNQAIAVLSTRPQSIDEVAEANGKHAEFGKTKKEMKEKLVVINDEHNLLRAVAGNGVDQMNGVQQQWDQFELMLDSHQLMIKEQVDVLRQNVGARVKTVNDEGERLLARWNQFKPKSDTLQGDRATMIKAIEFIREKRQQFDELKEQSDKLLKECEQFDVDPPTFPHLEEMSTDLEEFEANWLLYETFNQEMDELAKEEWIVFRSKTYLFDEFLQKWVEKLKTGQQTHMGVRLMKDIENFQEFSSSLKFCRGEQLSTDHWMEMFRMLKLPKGTTIERLKFGDLIGVQSAIIENVDVLKQLNARAQGEVAIREAIQELEMWAQQSEFALTDYKRSNGNVIRVIKEWKEAINSTQDSRALLQSLKSSPFYAQFSDKTGIWETRLGDLDVFLSQMNEIQRKWIYLEPIFGRDALPSEASRFARVDNEFRAILNDVSRDPRLVSLCSRHGLKTTLETIVDQLNRCQRALNQFLEDKRSAFPRFYFLGDDDLLEILGQSTNPTVIQAHLKKLFQGIDRVVFTPGNDQIITMVSSHGESVNLSKPVRVVPQVETWLQQLSEEMRDTLRKLVIDAVKDGRMDPNRYPSQVLCLAEEIRFCRDCEQVLSGGPSALMNLKTSMNSQLESYTSSTVSDKILELKLKALILDLVHRIGVVDQLINDNTSSTKSWMWQKQLRFYVERDRVIMRQVNSVFEYTYEYQGNAAKLVHTPLTDKCYLTLTQAMSMGLGGNPYGPAGTGKTESVKALASLFGRQVLVFNCDEGIDVHSLSRIFVGIVQCGAWGCFDEFNRLDSTVLSAVSSQVQTIQDAIKNKLQSCNLGGKSVSVNSNSAIFITLNPAGKGYGGRQKLPDNLKQLFRPVVMSVPDNELIAETELFSDGFKEAKELARKVVALFRLSKEMLSAQQHYDWGLRALKTVLRGCGDLRRKKPEQSERNIVVQALLLNTLSKLTYSDSVRFNELIDDIFNKVDKEMTKFEQLLQPLKDAAEKWSISLDEKKLQKVFELYEQLRQRIGVVIVGPSGSGKSTLWKLLQSALLSNGEQLSVVHFNPKAMSRIKLLGHMDMDTREWTDGVITSAARQVIRDTSRHTWIICDGDIDPEWIEALNSVLDDNRLLTMPSGERIQFGSNVNFIFETDDLTFASPATISRMGMIFMSLEDLTAAEQLTKWIVDVQKQDEGSENISPDLPSWISESVGRCVTWTQKKIDSQLSMTTMGIVQCAMGHIRRSRNRSQFLVGLYRGLSAIVPSDTRKELAEQVFQGMTLPSLPSLIYSDGRSDSLLSYTDDIGLPVKLDQMQHERRRPFILTAQAQANRDTVLSWLSEGNRQPFIVVGPDGCGKEELLRSCLEMDTSSQVAVLHCSAQSNAANVLQALQTHCVLVSSASGRVYRPKDKHNLVLYLKGINLPLPDRYGTSELLSFIQQMLTYSGFYDDHFEWIGLENIQIVGSMSIGTGAGRHQIPARLLSLLRLCSIDLPSMEDLTTIATAYLMPILEPSLQSAVRIESVASTMVRVFSEVRQAFRTTDQAHYIFTPRDLTKWIVSMLRYELVNDPEVVQKTVANEAMRIFRDRLVSQSDIDRFDSILMETMRIGSKRDDSYFVTQTTVVQTRNSIGIPLTCISKTDYGTFLNKAVNRYEFEVADFKPALLDEICELCSKIDRVLTTPGGSLLLAGRSGLGRLEVVRLISNIHQIPVFTPCISSNYGQKQFDLDLKSAIQGAISNSEHVVFILEDYQIVSPLFLQSINCLLSSGEVPRLFNQQEFDSLAPNLREQAAEESFEGNLYEYFAYRTQSLVHVVLIMDTDGRDFGLRLSSNPALCKQCTVIWRNDWLPTSLQMMPSSLLSSIGPSGDVVGAFSPLYQSAPEQLPRKFVSFIENYAAIYGEKKRTIKTRLDRLKAGVSKLTAARETVAKMQKKAGKKSKLLAEKQAEADEALGAITKSMTGATDQKQSMEELRAATEKENAKIEEQKIVIEEQLSEVEPLLREAREAVGSIKSESLSEIRSLRAPPEAVRDILQAVLLFMGILDTSWEAMRKFLAKSGVKEEIINFDAHRITSDVHKKVSTLVKQKSASFDPKKAKRASAAAAPLAGWVMANLQYSQILEKISPLEKVRKDLEQNLSKAEKQMEKLSKGLLTVDQQVAELKARFESLMKEATQIKVNLDKEQEVISVAGTLVDRLSGEFKRWNEQINTLESELNQLERHALLSAAFVTFLGGSSERVRRTTIDSWRSICRVENFDLLHFCALETEQLNWKSNGLPPDVLSVENAVILFNGVQTPLIIDPTGRVAKFLESQIPNTTALKAAQPDLSTQIELGIRFGKTIVIGDANDIDAMLVPLLRKDISSQGPRKVVKFADKQLDMHDDFRLFICTRNEQIQIPAHIRSLLAEINFTTTRSGLTSQLLGIAIEMEKPELEARSSELTHQTELSKLELDKLEQILLQELANAEGDLLENTSLLDSLNMSKENAERISNSIAETETLRKKLAEERDVYLSFADFASSLFFAFVDLHRISHMYNFNVNSIIKIYRRIISECKETGPSRLDSLQRSLHLSVFNHVSRSLFKSDRLMFAMAFVRGTQHKLFLNNEWEHLCGSLVEDEKENTRSSTAKPGINWIDEEQKGSVARLQRNLPSLYNALQLEDQGTWSEYAKSTEAENSIPKSIEQKITPFQKVLLIQSTRPDRLYSAMHQFALKAIGVDSINPTPFDLFDIYKESNADEPILLLTVSGADPSQELEEAAQKGPSAGKFESISMGQGQEQAAIEAIRRTAESGAWLSLNNVHLMLGSIPLIQKELALVKRHENFRVWMTCEADDRFPAILLQESLKVTFESPPGIRNNLIRSYSQFEGGHVKSVITAQTLFVAAWLHALLQERRTYIPQAWTKFYEFSSADIRMAKAVVEELTQGLAPDWSFIRGLFEFTIYGGRIENVFDLSVLKCYLRRFFNSSRITGRDGEEVASGIDIIPSSRLEDYVAHIEKVVPAGEDSAALFGLPANVRFAWQLSEAENTIALLRMAGAAGGAAAATRRQQWSTMGMILLNHWKRLLGGSDLHTRNREVKAKITTDPVAQVMSLELSHAIGMIQGLHSSLTQLNRVIKGVISADSKMEELLESVLLQQTPDAWQSLWYGPRDPVEYLTSAVYRAKCTQDMCKAAESNELLLKPINMGKLFRPATILTALRQMTARKQQVEMDALELRSSWEPSKLQGTIAITVTGLQLQGAIFDGSHGSTLKPSAVSSPPTSTAPPLVLAWTKSTDPAVYPDDQSINVPIYSNPERIDLVATVQMPCNAGETDRFGIAAVALLLK